MKQKRILAMLLSFSMIFSMLTINISVYAETSTLPSFSGGTGTETDPFLLANADDLIALRDSVNTQTDDTLIDAKDNCGLGCYHGYYFKLTKDIDMTGVTDWTPLNFCGTLDGAGHAISNLQMKETAFDDDGRTSHYAAFFGQLVHAQIKNIYFEKCTATISSNVQHSDRTYRDIYASIVAYAAIASGFENVSVVDCTVSQNGKPRNMGYAAGLIAYAEISNISNCSVQGGSINVGGSAVSMYIGGLVGAVSDMYNEYITDYDNPFNMQVGAGNDFGIYNSFSTAKISVQNATGTATGGLIGMVECFYLDFTCKNCMVGGTITASNYAAGLIGSCDTSKRRNIDTNAENCVIYSIGIQGGKYADCLYRPDGGNKDVCPVTFTNCKVSDATSVSVTDTESGSVTNYGEITSTALTEVDCQVSDFKSNLHGKLTDGTQDVTITLSQNDEVKYTAVTDNDGEYNFGKQLAKGEYTLKASSIGYKAYETNVAIDYATNKNLDIMREIKPVTINSAINLTAPVKNATPQTSIETDEYTATVVWSPEIAEDGTFAKSTKYTATITITPKTNYTVSGIAENGYTLDGATSVTNAADSNVVTAVFPKTAGSSGGGSSVTRYTVKFNTNGGNTVTSQTVKKNSKATEPTEPTKEGYIFDGWYTDSKFANEYDFDTKVTKNIILYAKWVEDEIQEPSDDKKDDTNDKKDDNSDNTDDNKPTTDYWKNPFDDVKDNEWYFDNVKYANENGLMSGTTDTTFAPNDNLTRGMLVTVLYRAEGEPAVNKSIPFADVKADMYYANAVIWAEQNGIVKGVSETEFAPDENITREQIATIIYRYAEYKGIAPTGTWAIKLDYADVADISDYAVEGVMYCTMKNIMQGKNNNMFAPKGNATRAEIAAIFNRFIENNK